MPITGRRAGGADKYSICYSCDVAEAERDIYAVYLKERAEEEDR